MGDHPLIFTEIGIPYDMDNKYAYKTGDYSSQASAMDANHFALEGSNSNGFTLWLYMTQVWVSNYLVSQRRDCSCHSQNDHEWGDQWNGEDLSIFSKDDLELPNASVLGQRNGSTTSLDRNSPSFSQSQSTTDYGKVEPHNIKNAVESPHMSSGSSNSSPELASKPGFRAAEAYIRPSPIYTNGDLLRYGFDLRNCTFTLSLSANGPTAEHAPTEIFLPEFHFPSSQTVVNVSGGKWTIESDEEVSSTVQRLRWWHGEGEQDIKIRGVKRKAGEILNSDEDETYLEQCQKNTCNVM